MNDSAGNLDSAKADPRADELARAAAIGLALMRAKHDLNNLFHVGRGWSRLLKDPRSSMAQTQEGIEALLAASAQTSELVGGILALGGALADTDASLILAEDLTLLARGLRYLLLRPDRLRVTLASEARVRCNLLRLRNALLDTVLRLRESLGDDLLELHLLDALGDANVAPEVEVSLVRVPATAALRPERMLAMRFSVTIGAVTTRPLHVMPSAEPAPQAAPQTILLVDEHRDVRRLATTMLERAGYQVLTASDAEEALLTSNDYDGPIQLLCCDAELPGMQPAELIATLCGARPGLEVLVSGSDLPHGKLGDFARLPKPFSYRQLIAAVRGCLE
ncbi:MAG TPA: response regulator [Polyangiaceae bacterium]|jgi:CheY-like chemotaxis protein|nr:response regulator [Polyangiaceae bacterium]